VWADTGALFNLYEEGLTDLERTFGVSCHATGFSADSTLPFEEECPGVSACLRGVSSSPPADCSALQTAIPALASCFANASCCARFPFALDLWHALPGLASCAPDSHAAAALTSCKPPRKPTPADVECPGAVECAEALGMPLACEEVTEQWKEASAACFSDQGCCKWYPYFLENWLFSTPELASAGCGFTGGEYGGSACAPAEEWAWINEFQCPGLPECAQGVYEAKYSDCTFYQELHKCFADTGCCAGWPSVLAELNGQCNCAGDFGSHCGPGSEGDAQWWCFCTQISTLTACMGPLDPALATCDTLAGSLDQVKACFSASCCQDWEAFTVASVPHLTGCDWGAAPTCDSPAPSLPVDACGASLEQCLETAAGGVPTSCAQVDAIKGRVVTCFEDRACCSAWPQATEYFKWAFSLSECDFTAACQDAPQQIAAFHVTLPLSQDAFSGASETAFIAALALAADVSADKVTVVGVRATTIRPARRLLSDGIVVDVEMEVSADATGATLTSKLQARLDSALQANGLPASASIGAFTLQPKPELTPPGSMAGSARPSWVLWGVALAAMLLRAA